MVYADQLEKKALAVALSAPAGTVEFLNLELLWVESDIVAFVLHHATFPLPHL